PLLEPLLLKLLEHPRASIREHAAVAAFTLRGSGVQELPYRWLDLYTDRSRAVRAVAVEFRKTFAPPTGPEAVPFLGAAIPRLLASPHPEAWAAALDTIDRVGFGFQNDD